MSVIQNLDVNLRSNIKDFSNGLNKAKSQTKSFSSGITSLGSKASAALAAGLTVAATAAAAAVAALAAGALALGAALVSVTKSQFGVVDGLAKTSDKLGIATESLIGLQHAAEQTGVETNELEASMQRMVRGVSEVASTGSGTAKKALDDLGLSASNLAAKSPDQQLGAIADALQGVENQSDKVRLAFSLFGRSGVGMLNTLKGGSKGLQAFQDEAKELGLVISREQAGKIEAANDAIDRMKKSFIGIGRQLAVIVAPYVQKVADFLKDVMQQGKALWAFFKPTMTQLGNVFKATWEVAKQAWSVFVNAIRPVFQPVVDWLTKTFGSVFGESMGEFQDKALSAFIMLEFGITNWQRVTDLAFDKVDLGLQMLGNGFIHFFTSVLPKALTSFGEASISFFKSYVHNAGELFQELYDYITSGGTDAIDLNFKSMTDGFAKAFDEVGKTLERPLTDSEKALMESIKSQELSLASDLSNFMAERMAELKDVGKETEEAIGSATPDVGDIKAQVEVDANVEGPSAVSKGSTEAFSIINNALKKQGDPALKVARESKAIEQKQKEALDKIERMMRNNGLGVAIV